MIGSPWSETLKQDLEEVASTIRGLSIDGVEAANSGHPGLPLGCAEIGAYLYGYLLRHNPKNSDWFGRDRFILSAGHGSMLLYSCLHLAGFNLSMDQIKKFRQLHSETPGHPESFETDGVETTTGPLGQGLGNAVGQALGLKLLAAQFNTPDYPIFSSKVFCLVGDGCIMEGVTSEVSSFAGHLNLDNLVVIYDANEVSLDGPLSESCSENTKMRYESYGWDVFEVDGHDLNALQQTFSKALQNQTKPLMIIAHTIIGKGSPHKAGTSHAHGSPLGKEETRLTKEALGISLENFYVPETVRSFFERKLKKDREQEQEWNVLFENWSKKFPEKRAQFDVMKAQALPADLEEILRALPKVPSISTRKASQVVLTRLGELFPFLYGGSADLSGSDMTFMKQFPAVEKKAFEGRNIKYGVREFGMATIAAGLYQTKMIVPFIGTFLTFSDYMRNGIRLACLMKLRVIYQFTHDSVFLGEDGPTHQPVEHLASLRAIPNLNVIRPADFHETAGAWYLALRYQGPTALILSRQNLPTLEETNVPFKEGIGRGGYVLKKEKGTLDYTLLATGSEVTLALEVAKKLEAKGKGVRVVSIPCWEIFDLQPESYREETLGGQGIRVSLEAGVTMGWEKYVTSKGMTIGINRFGASGKDQDLAVELGFTSEAVLKRILG